MIQLDNLFTLVRLLTQLYDEGYSVASIARTLNTQREILEEDEGKIKKEFNRGLNLLLANLKINYNSQLEQGSLYGYVLKDSRVLKFVQKDQNVVLFITTVLNKKKTVIKNRRRLVAIATNTRTLRTVFGTEAVKKLKIPKFINIYNYFIDGVDQVDQLRYYYNI